MIQFRSTRHARIFNIVTITVATSILFSRQIYDAVQIARGRSSWSSLVQPADVQRPIFII